MTYAMNGLSQGTATLTTSDGLAAGQQLDAAAAKQAKDAFTRKLQDLVDDSWLWALADKKFYIHDTPKLTSWFGAVVVQQPKPGFDCDDYSDALYNYLSNKFLNDNNVTIMFVDVFGAKDGKNTGHSMLVVKNGSDYWLVDPQSAIVKGSYSSLSDVSTKAVPEIMTDPNGGYRYSKITSTEYLPNRAEWQAKRPAEPQPWHTSNNIRTEFNNKITSINKNVNIDVDDYYPHENISVQDVDPNPSGYDASEFFATGHGY